MKLSKLKDRKAISPVIATVILVAVAITIAVAVAYWMGGISSQYTKFEKVEIQSGWSTRVTGTSPAIGWNVTLQLKNSGSAPATLSQVFLNSRPLNTTGYGATAVWANIAAATRVVVNIPATGLTLNQGESHYITILISNDSGAGTKYAYFTSGTTVDIKIHSAGGMDYIKLLELV